MKEVNKPQAGLDLDSSPENQQKGHYSFALNTVIETHGGDLGNVSNERGNELYLNLPAGYVLIGTHYIGGGETVVFLTNNDANLDQIGIVYGNQEYEEFIKAPLGFRVSNMIDCVFQLRRGCQRVIYFADDFNK